MYFSERETNLAAAISLQLSLFGEEEDEEEEEKVFERFRVTDLVSDESK